MDFGDLARPFLNVLGKEISASVDHRALAVEVTDILKMRTDEEWAHVFDNIIKGGKIAEAIDYSIGLSYIKKLRAWCEKRLSGDEKK